MPPPRSAKRKENCLERGDVDFTTQGLGCQWARELAAQAGATAGSGGEPGACSSPAVEPRTPAAPKVPGDVPSAPVAAQTSANRPSTNTGWHR